MKQIKCREKLALVLFIFLIFVSDSGYALTDYEKENDCTYKVVGHAMPCVKNSHI